MRSLCFRHVFGALAVALALMLVAPTSASATGICGIRQVSTLWAGQTINAGTVTVSNDADKLSVKYTTQNGWVLKAVHLYVLDGTDEAAATGTGPVQKRHADERDNVQIQGAAYRRNLR
ncbi:MAG: hypothetical protein JNM75_06210 [Rhodospirillales bacterium]|nr:hypothetical protein [Rhodospirillales bacterium]